MKQAMVFVNVRVDVEKAQAAGHGEMAARFLEQFRAQGEEWRREAQADPLVRQF